MTKDEAAKLLAKFVNEMFNSPEDCQYDDDEGYYYINMQLNALKKLGLEEACEVILND